MANRDDPSAVRWLVGVELIRYRERAGQTITAAAKEIACSPGKISHMESGRNQQQPAEVTALMRFYGADQAAADRLASLASSAGDQTWWAPWTDVVPDWLSTFVGLEGLATHAVWYSPLVLPALLQTGGYALGVTAGSIRVRPDHNERMVSLRMERQSRLFDDEEPLNLTAILEEVVLHRPIGGPSVMRAQLEHLIAVAQRDNVELLVLPTAVGAHDALVGPFTALDFTSAQSIAYVELVNGAVYVQDQDQVAVYARIIDRLREVALAPARSVEVIRSYLTAMP
ncbi:MAG: helix-turn-helix domain-containing protein [Pseudonocardia sp.]